MPVMGGSTNSGGQSNASAIPADRVWNIRGLSVGAKASSCGGLSRLRGWTRW